MQPKLVTIKYLEDCGLYPFTSSQLKHMFEARKNNGLIYCTRKIGKRLYVNLGEFDNWIDGHKEANPNEGTNTFTADYTGIYRFEIQSNLEKPKRGLTTTEPC